MKDIDKELDKIPTFHRDDDFGDWLHDLLMPEFGLETQEHALEKVRKAQDRLQVKRPQNQRYITEILWIPDPTAFTAPGRYVYFSRELLQRMPSEEAVAFVIAHEISHHDLGHVYTFHGQSIWRWLPAHAVLTGLLYQARRLANSPRQENDADANALIMCAEAGYDPEKCLVALDILEMLMLDLNQIDAVFGPEEVAEDSPSGTLGRLKAEFQHWKWEHNVGYASLRDRKDALQAILKSGLDSDGPAEVDDSDYGNQSRLDRADRLYRFDAGLERWHFGMVSLISVVTEVMRTPVYRLLTGRDGPRAQYSSGSRQGKVDDALTRFETVRHQLYLLMALLDHADSARRRINSQNPNERALINLEKLLAEESSELARVEGGAAIRDLFQQHDVLNSGSLQQFLEELGHTAQETRSMMLEPVSA